MNFLSGRNKQAKFLSQVALIRVDHRDIANPQWDFAQDIATLHGNNFARKWSAEEIQSLLSNENHYAIIARGIGKKGASMGFILMRETLDEAEVLAIAVNKKHRKIGLGWQLMRAAVEWLKSHNVRKIFLEVDESNQSAIALYKNFAFKTVGKRGAYYAKENEQAGNALVMRLDLD